MFSRKIFLVIICLFIGVNLFAARGSKRDKKPAANLSTEELNQLYDRGVKYWESGNGRNSFYTLDSLRKIDLTSENANIKSKGMIYLANCFYSQKNYRYAINYLNLALMFGKDILNVDTRLSVYDMLITCHHETKNNSQESYFTQLKKSITDSIQTAKMQAQVDSLKQALEAQKNTPTSTTENENPTETASTTVITNNITYKNLIIIVIVIGAIAILFFMLFRKSEGVSSAKPKSNEIPKIDANGSKGSNALVEKIAKVELVFIRAEVLGEYGNKKAVVKIINDYNTQLPLIIKNLDEAITTNDNEPIINALSYLKPYLTAFGMAATLAMLNEVESEAPTEKTTKLLSRVFQIRNHIRRAHDESKALIDMLG
jgi:tetratricopeptide (TPR) repeat protein